MSDKKKSIVEAINSMASLGAVFAGEVAGQSVETEMTRTLEDLPEQVVWDDGEEVRYREWLKLQMEKAEEADFREYEGEEAYRERLREEAEERGADKVDWEDKEEWLYRQKYQEEEEERRRLAKGQAVEWGDDMERAAREKQRQEMEDRRKQPVVWDLDKFGNPI